MIAETPLALTYILPADVYLLDADKPQLDTAPQTVNYQEPPTAIAPHVSEPTVPELTPVIPPPLVEAMEVTAPAPIMHVIETAAPGFKYTGGNAQKFLIVVHYPDHDMMEPAHHAALASTIKRRELSLDDVAIFNLAKHPGTELKAIGAFFKPRKMLLMGGNTFPVGLTPPVLNQITKLGKCDMLYSYSFGEMMGNREYTKAFWEQMKAL
jgi:hypothetical protein